ncbi:MAG: GIY-YIG nuclease family protein [Candidatus Yanofskybacteria bacterium]|nr:GIY-YIG nuclease family protein [Candidatus Yanofskybacteria bacterium]
MFYLYILKSARTNQLYIGYTADLQRRLKEHRSGLVRSTKSSMPYRCIYYEAYRFKQDAVTREHNLKLRARALHQLLSRIRESAGVTAQARLVSG